VGLPIIPHAVYDHHNERGAKEYDGETA